MNPINYSYEAHESYAAFALEPNAPPAPNATSIPTGPALADYKLFGYGQALGLEFDTGAMGIEATPAFQDVETIQTTNNISLSGEITLAASDQTITVVDLAFRSPETAADQTTLCLPLFSVGWGYLAGCEAGRGSTDLIRHCMFNSFAMTAGEGQPVRASVEIWGHYSQSSNTLLDADIGANEEGASIFHESLRWDTVDVTIDGQSWRDNLSSISIGISNNLKRKGIRKKITGGGAALSLTPVWLQPGKQQSTLSMNFNSPLPAAIRSGEIGPIVMVATGYYGDTLKTLTVTIGNASFAQGGRGAIGASDSATYNATFQPRNVSAVWS